MPTAFAPNQRVPSFRFEFLALPASTSLWRHLRALRLLAVQIVVERAINATSARPERRRSGLLPCTRAAELATNRGLMRTRRQERQTRAGLLNALTGREHGKVCLKRLRFESEVLTRLGRDLRLRSPKSCELVGKDWER